MEQFLNKLNEISEFFIRMDQKIGFKKIVKYVFLILLVLGIVNFKTVVKEVVEIVSEITEEQHNEKMKLRDELLRDLQPMLNEIRAQTRADRVLYLEYHNSKENLVGIPFKYADLVLQASSYNVTTVPENLYKDINTGAITSLYEELKHNIISSDDSMFCYKFPGTYELFNGNDGSNKQVFVSIPGVDQPIGMLIFEWVDEDVDIDIKRIEYILGGHGGNYLSRINGLIMSKQLKK
jgi:hypothetical protein